MLETNNKRKIVWNILRYLAIIFGLALCLFPLYVMITTSLKNEVDAFQIPPKFFFTPVLSNYIDVLTEKNFLRFFINSTIVALSSTALSVTAAAMAAYVLVRRTFIAKKIFSSATFLMKTIPPVILVVPVFILFRDLGISDSRLSLILVYTALTMPFGIWLLSTFIAELPLSIEESAYIDGCSSFQTFFKIVIPLIGPGLSVAAIFTFRTAWNEFILSLVLTNRLTRTLPVAVSLYLTDAGTQWGQITAIATIIAIPAFFFTFFAARNLITGITAGSIKG